MCTLLMYVHNLRRCAKAEGALRDKTKEAQHLLVSV
jgi:hypothetical protein